MSDAGPVVTVIGAGSGIGRAVALKFATLGASVFALSRDIAALESLSDQTQPLPGTCRTYRCDVTDTRALQATLDEIGAWVRHGSIVVHTAGSVLPIGPVWGCEPAEALASLSTMIDSAWVATHVCLRQLQAAGSGIVLLASSGAARKLATARTVYSMSKAAVDQLVRVAGAELRATGVNAVGIAGFYPGFVDTKMQADVRAAAQAYAGTPFAADLQPFVGVASSKKLRPAAFVAERLVELTAMPTATLNGKIWRLADGGWTAED